MNQGKGYHWKEECLSFIQKQAFKYMLMKINEVDDQDWISYRVIVPKGTKFTGSGKLGLMGRYDHSGFAKCDTSIFLIRPFYHREAVFFSTIWHSESENVIDSVCHWFTCFFCNVSPQSDDAVAKFLLNMIETGPQVPAHSQQVGLILDCRVICQICRFCIHQSYRVCALTQTGTTVVK